MSCVQRPRALWRRRVFREHFGFDPYHQRYLKFQFWLHSGVQRLSLVVSLELHKHADVLFDYHQPGFTTRSTDHVRCDADRSVDAGPIYKLFRGRRANSCSVEFPERI
jgi:hypothetical protein